MSRRSPKLALLLFTLTMACAETTDSTPSPTQDVVTQQDDTPPTWPEGALLTTSDVAGNSLVVHWPAAIDDEAVVSYEIAVDGLEHSQVSGNASSAMIMPLQSATNYTVELRAKDAAGNRSEPLSTVVTTADVTKPVWPPSASLNVDNISETSAQLAWSAASDDVGVLSYQILHNTNVLATVEDATSYSLSGLAAWTEYNISVVALDATGNRSETGPSAIFHTLDESPPMWNDTAVLFTSNITSKSVTLSWPDATDNVDITKYELLRDQVVVATTNAYTTSVNVNELPPGTTHSFSIRATDPAGNVSTTGPSVTLNTLDDSPPSWPAGASLLVSNLLPQSLTLAWTAASDDVGVAVYRVYQGGVEVAQVSQTNVELNDLSPWTSYNFVITAEDGAQNIANDSLSVSVQTPDNSPPGWAQGDAITVSNLTPFGLTLSWPLATDDASVQGYNVYQDDVLIAELGAQSTSLDVGALSPWTNYSVRVAAFDPAGNSAAPGLSLDVLTPDESTPSWPAGALTATEIASTSVTLAWTAAQDDVAVTQYRLFVDDVAYALVDGPTTSAEILGLSPWTDYSFRVEAGDEAGNWSQDGPSTILKTLDEVAPDWPEESALMVETLTATNVTLSWPAALDDVAIDHYAFTVDGAPALTANGDATSATLDSLHPAVTYLISIRAIDPAGNPSPWLSVTVTTPDGGPPTWQGATLSATAGMTDVYLSWTPAVDDVTVTAYRVFKDGAQIAELMGSELFVDGLGPSTEYSFKVEAGDAAGNWSEDGPSATVTTAKAFDPGFRRLTQEQFERTLADTIGPVWQKGCNHELTYGPDGCAWPRDADAWYWYITTYSGWSNYRTAYPADSHTGAPGEARGGFKRLDSIVYNEHMTSWVSAIMKIANNDFEAWVGAYWLTQRPCVAENNAGITNFATQEEIDENCISNFITDLGTRAFRRPLTAEEHAFFMTTYNEVGEQYAAQGLDSQALFKRAVRNVLANMLLSPEFLYHVELGDENGNLTAYELASRLSYHFWNTMPDDALFAAAEDGSLLTEAGYQTQVDRLAGDPKADRAIDEFYRDYFRVQDITDPFVQDGPSTQYHGGPDWNFYSNPVSDPSGSMRDELANLGAWFTASNPGTFEDMFRSNLHFLECHYPSHAPDQCYGAGPWSFHAYAIPGCDGKDADGNFPCTGGGWDGVSPPITFPETERAGLLTRLAFLGHDTHKARPIRRGLKIREVLLCDPIPPPENCDVVRPPILTGLCDDPTKAEDDETNLIKSCSDDQHCAAGETCKDWDKELTMTVRGVVEELTETPGTSCAGCHSTFINGFGHALGHFSSRGQYWETEHLFETQKLSDGTWAYYGLKPEEEWAPIDATGTTIINGQWVTVDGAQGLADTLVDSGQMEWCWSREYFRFAMGRIEWDVDQDTIESFAQTLRDGATLADAFRAIAHLPQFKTLYKPPKAQPNGDTP